MPLSVEQTYFNEDRVSEGSSFFQYHFRVTGEPSRTNALWAAQQEVDGEIDQARIQPDGQDAWRVTITTIRYW